MLQNAGVLYILPCKCASRHSGVPFLDMWTYQKVARECGVFHILTYKYASRHSGVPFLNIATSKMAPPLWCFAHFDFANVLFATAAWHFGTSELPKWLRRMRCFATFWLANVLFATAAWHFGTSELPKCLRRWGVFYILTRKCASRHSRVPFFTCPLRTATSAPAALAKLLFEHQEPRLIEKTQRFATSLTFGAHVELLATDSTRMLIFLLLTLHACWSSCYWHDCCATLLFNSTYCRKLDF